jgi:hypothetical protein
MGGAHLFVQRVCSDDALAGRVQQRSCDYPLQLAQRELVLRVVWLCDRAQLRQLLGGGDEPALVYLPLEERGLQLLQVCLVAVQLLRVPGMPLLCLGHDARVACVHTRKARVLPASRGCWAAAAAAAATVMSKLRDLMGKWLFIH